MAKDRYRYFRIEARELLDELSKGLLALEHAPGDRDLVARLLRHAHTLKGAARVVQQLEIGDLAHEAEDALAAHREAAAPPVARERVDALLDVVDRIATRVAALDPAPAAPAGPGAAPAAAPATVETLRVDPREVDAVLDAALEAGAQVSALRRGLGELDHAREIVQALSDHLALRRGDGEAPAAAPRLRALVDELGRTVDGTRRALDAGADGAAREVAQLRVVADRLRLAPARGAFAPLERAARDAARALDREVALETSGGEVRLDTGVLARVADALLHAVRNAVAHGVEPAADRVRAGKPRAGRVRVEVERRGDRVLFRCADDGRGIDAAAVRAAAVRRGLVSDAAARALDADALSALLLRGGISTSPELTAVAGRGVGLDVVRDVAAQLRADVALRSVPGRGTTLELSVPASLAAVAALHVAAAGGVVALPLAAVREAVRVEASGVARAADGTAIALGGALVPFLPLDAVLGGAPQAAPAAPAPGPRRAWSAVVLEADGARFAVGADRLVGTGEVVVRPLPAFVAAEPAIAGAALDAEGDPRLVLDPAGLLAAVRARRRTEAQPEARPRAPILVVDDSLTTRMLEQSILESAGYEVELAVSAEDALERMRGRRFGLLVVDVEMPGMDGFELVRATRDPRHGAIPAILVTSRAAAEDRARGLEAGASAYLVKSEFDQGRLLAHVRELVG